MSQHSDIHAEEALEIIRQIPHSEEHTAKRFALEVPVDESVNRVLAEDVKAQADSPRRDNSAMDGFVFRKDDLDRGIRRFPVSGEVRPELETHPPIRSGHCARILTGAMIPEGGDVVIPVEQVDEIGEKEIEIRQIPQKNPVRKKGEGFKKGDVLLKEGAVIRPYEMGMIIEAGLHRCRVRPHLRIGLQVTGSEISEENNSNGPVLQSLMSSWPSTQVEVHPVIPDNPDRLKMRLRSLKDTSDLIVTTGGISAGKYDHLFDTLTELGARPLIRKIRQKPGKPLTIFIWDETVVCCLPGNPVSAVFTAEVYARSLARRLLGQEPVRPFRAKLCSEVSNNGGRTLFLPVRLDVDNGTLRADPGGDTRMRSHLLQLYRGCSSYLIVPPDAYHEPGNYVTCYPFSKIEML
ncbi:molybdopterin molybdotransferase MoeA [Natronogracilivirga saccharolytica]|uniref:Molybdopterin molybdenumtransferase n=1 Tax=Natronogracilivirga saccharolytica TaxID=2812953 RepID=A0A8J7SBL5_9BACT|nr:molybdopterin molybdotransferase MoeA [Natronogracilivirga saccharolytica]MBP3193301.1 molybdopterin molybdotransferase MoeA [Natronogracilivirga saccharolytica]